jgi:hypothetical protein
MIHYGRVENSDRLKRFLDVLSQGPATTREIIERGHVCAVNSIAAELKAQGYVIDCKPVSRGVFEYKLVSYPHKFDQQGQGVLF